MSNKHNWKELYIQKKTERQMLEIEVSQLEEKLKVAKNGLRHIVEDWQFCEASGFCGDRGFAYYETAAQVLDDMELFNAVPRLSHRHQ